MGQFGCLIKFAFAHAILASRFAQELSVKIVYRAENIIDAHLVKNALEDAGIPAFVNGYHLTGAMGELPVADLVNVMIAEHDIELAEPVVRAVDAALSEARGLLDEDFDGMPHPA